MPELTYNELLRDAMIRHQIGILRYSGSVRNSIWLLLDATEKDLKKQILAAKNAGIGSKAKVKQLDKLLVGLRESRGVAWSAARTELTAQMNALAVGEVGFVDRIMANTFPVDLGSTLPSVGELRNIATATPMMGKTVSEWAKDLERADIARIEQAVKIGMTQGESLPAITRRVVGTRAFGGVNGMTQTTRRNVASVTRTITSGIGAEARAAYAEANKQIMPFEKFTATLDSHTTPICMRWDSSPPFKVGEGPRLPLHIGERSVYVPIIDDVYIGERPRRSFTERSLLRDFAKEEGIRAPRSRTGLPRGTKGRYDAFARKRMRDQTGRVPARTTYQDFLKRESAANQDDILGKTKGKLFRDGGLTVNQFVEDNGRVLTLGQLADRHTASFLRAGLDPTLFTD